MPRLFVSYIWVFPPPVLCNAAQRLKKKGGDSREVSAFIDSLRLDQPPGAGGSDASRTGTKAPASPQLEPLRPPGRRSSNGSARR